MEKMPEGGLALHGTTYAGAKRIAREGTVSGNLCYLPGAKALKGMDESEALKRATGAALLSVEKAKTDRGLLSPGWKKDDLPAIVIVKGAGAHSKGYLGGDTVWRVSGGFGEKPYFPFPNETVAARSCKAVGIVRLKPAELEALRKKHLKRNNEFETGLGFRRELQAKMAAKALAAIRKIIEEGEAGLGKRRGQ
jgi:hypothetical protein